MKRNWILRLVLCLVLAVALVPVTARAAGNVAINEKSFPDQIFREYVSANFDADGDGELSAEELENAVEIDLSGTEAADLTGLAAFTGLKVLNVSGTKVTAVNPAKNTALEVLNISGCAVKSLDVAKNTALKELAAGDTLLTSINVSKNTALELLDVRGCTLKSLDVSKNAALKTLDCTGTGLKELKVIDNKELEILACGGNKLSTLDVTGNLALKELYCQENKITFLDVSFNEALEILSCGKNGMSWLNVASNRALKELYCEGNTLNAMYLDENTALVRLNCSGNLLYELPVKQNAALEWLDCGNNYISSLNLTGNRGLKYLSCINNDLHKLTLNKNPELSVLECWGNDIRALDISYSNKLMDAYKYGTAGGSKGHTVISYSKGEETYEIGMDAKVVIQDGSVAAPLITVQPRSVSSLEGKAVSFTTNAVGEGLFYQWYYRQPGSDKWYPISGETGRTLRVTAEKKIDGYRYMCEIINRGGTEQTERVKLTVIYKPTITKQPTNQVGADGDKLTFMVVANGQDLSYQWYRKTPTDTEWVKVSSGTSAKYSFTAKSERDGTRYRCVVSNAAGKVTSEEAKMSVVVKPSITSQPQDATVAKNKKATFTVKATGGHLKYQWYVKYKGESSWTLMKGETDRTLQVKATSKVDKAEFRCKVTNAAGHVYSKTVKLRLK